MIRPLPAAIGFIICLLPSTPARGDSMYWSEATDLESGKLSYTEQNTARSEGGRLAELVTVYRNAAGDSIAGRSLVFRVSPFLPDYRLEDFRDGRLEGARVDSGSVRVYFRKAPRIEFTFDAATRRMRKYQGVSNLPKEDGGTIKVSLVNSEGGP